MRVEKNGISVHAIPGTQTILFGFDATEAARRELLGFALARRRADGSLAWMRGFKFFEQTAPNPQPGERRSTREHPVQDFQWGDYSVPPGSEQHYVIQAVYGKPDDLNYGPEIEISATTGNSEGSDHAVFFNFGAIPSQAFADRFGNVGPTEAEQNDPGNDKVKWLSRGLLEACLGFIAEATDGSYELRVAAYEFTYPPIAEALRAAAGRGVRVRLCFDAGDRRRDDTIKPSSTSPANLALIAASGLDVAANVSLHPRTRYAAIPHNKFIVLLKNGRPEVVWTGSTNFTPSGFLGQSNVAHLIRDPDLAATYSVYWEALADDPDSGTMRDRVMALTPTPQGESTLDQIVPIFSPRRKGMLEWYADHFGAAQRVAMFTAAFGVSKQMAAGFGEDRDYLRFLLMERDVKAGNIRELLTADRDTKIALGKALNATAIHKKLGGHALDEWFRAEEHFRKQGNIFYIHTKILGLDLLSDSPTIFTGSANFSDNSVERNDENMILMRGPRFQNVAQIYANEFMRLFNHLYFRTVAIRTAEANSGDASKAAILEPTDKWTKSYFRRGTYHFRKRELFR